MSHTIYQVDAFTNKVFGGNPAAVFVLDEPFSTELMQAIAIENNLSETAYCVRTEVVDAYDLRWFTPGGEVALCGHATLATAHVLRTAYQGGAQMKFHTLSGQLDVSEIASATYSMDFPSDRGVKVAKPAGIESFLGCPVVECLRGKDDLVFVIEDVEHLRQLQVDFVNFEVQDCRGFLVTAPSDRVDFESRCYFPYYNIPEDPVTGSAHTLLTPYWSERLGKQKLQAIQASPRTGHLTCTDRGDRIIVEGQAVTFLKGIIYYE